MKKMTVLLLALLWLFLSAVPALGEAPADSDAVAVQEETGADDDVQYVMYLGTNDKDTNRPVFTREEAMEQARNILIRYFGGYTIQEAHGGWMDEDTVYQEYTLVIFLSDTTEEQVHAAADELIRVFNQSSVLIQAIPARTEFYSRFAYEHDPRDNPAAMKDIVVNPEAVYGFSPSPDSVRLKEYADAIDWTDPEQVAEARARRQEYHDSMAELYRMIEDMLHQGKNVEEIARAVSQRRNEIRLEVYADDPEGEARVRKSNLETYGDEMGPTADSLYEKYGSWQTVLEKALGTNAGMDACLGFYDEYYELYEMEAEPAGTAVSAPAMMVGGWENVPCEAGTLPEDARTAFDKATEGMEGITYTPAALLSEQMVAGKNYCILCQSTADDPAAKPAWVLVYVHADLEGNAEIMNVYELYIDKHAQPAE